MALKWQKNQKYQFSSEHVLNNDRVKTGPLYY